MLPHSPHILRHHTRIALLATPSASSSFHHTPRCCAKPINPSNSVDARLGLTAPPPPLPLDSKDLPGYGDTSFLVHPRPGPNPNDLSDLLRGPPAGISDKKSKKKQDEAAGERSKRPETRRSVKITAKGVRRRGTTIPSTDLDEVSMMEEDARRRAAAAVAAAAEGGEVGPSEQDVVSRESPHSIDQMNGRNELDERVLNAARATYALGQGASLKTLNEQFSSESYKILPIELPYESTPREERRVPLPKANTSALPSVEEDDGILLLAFVDDVEAPRGQEKISVCTGFGVEGGAELAVQEGRDGGELVVTVAHTLRNSLPAPRKAKGGRDKSAALAITRKGLVYPVEQLVSSLPNSDLVLLRLAKDPLSVQDDTTLSFSTATTASTSARNSFKTLPISPYPAPQHSHLCVSSFWGFEDDSGCALPRFSFNKPSSSSTLQASATASLSILPPIPAPSGRSSSDVHSEGDAMSQSRWGEVRLVEYKDGKGSEAQPGTYDSLETLEYKLVQDSLINPAVLRGEKPKFVPETAVPISGSSAGASVSTAAALQEASSAQAQGQQGGEALAAGEMCRGYGGYGVPNFPPPGSSGGPIVDMSTGAVVGVTRGCKMTTLGGRRGEGVPSEKIFEFFTLPGMGKKQLARSTSSRSSSSSAQRPNSEAQKQKRSLSTSARVTDQVSENTGAGVPIGKIDQRLSLTFTCAVEDCGHRSTHEFSKASYTKGIVLVQCPGCKNRHLIADHLSWFTDNPSDSKTVEEMVRERGGRVRTGRKFLDDGQGDQGETMEILTDSDWDEVVQQEGQEK